MKIFAVGFNYEKYNKDAEVSLYKEGEPVVFTKADSALLKNRRPLFLPDDLGPVDAEGELVVRICRLGKSIPARFAHRYYDAVTCGVDFTARQLFRRLCKEGGPWELSKGFDGAAAIGDWLPLDQTGGIDNIHFRLCRNGQPVQQGFSADMLQGVDNLIAYISRWFTLRTGDILYTGAPMPPMPVDVDDRLEGWVDDKKVLQLNVK